MTALPTHSRGVWLPDDQADASGDPLEARWRSIAAVALLAGVLACPAAPADAEPGTTERASVSSAGTQGNAPPPGSDVAPGSFTPSLSADGRFVAFGSGTSNALGASVLLRLDPVELVVYLDHAPKATSIDTIVADAACQYIRGEEVPLPVPYTVRVFQRSGESHRYVPQHSPIGAGLLSKCPATLDDRRTHGTALE